MDNFYNTHYIELDAQSRIISGWSDGLNPDRDTSSAYVLREDGGYQFRLYPDGEENPPLTDMDGVHLYKYTDGQVLETTPDERAAELAEIVANLPPPAPTAAERITALESDLAAANAKNAALVESQQFLEDCLAEMAGVVYA